MTTDSPSQRWLAIGDFAAATQLSLKALRLYAEQHLLVPARVDAATGYRYYRSDQVAKGRLIRTLREMGLSLADIASVIAASDVAARRLLDALAKEQDRRYGREKRAYRAALVQLQPLAATQVLPVLECARAGATVACHEFLTDQENFMERYRAESQLLLATLAASRLTPAGAACCRLVDPLSQEEGRAEIMVPVQTGVPLSAGLTFRQLAAAQCATIILDGNAARPSQFAAALDTLFDWFDRKGRVTMECPMVCVAASMDSLRIEISWPFALTESPGEAHA